MAGPQVIVHGLPTRIVVPVFNALAATRNCIEAVLRHTPAEVVIDVFDDASTDPAISPYLAALMANHPDRVRVMRQSVNLGFVGNCNSAFAACCDHVLLLNSDTVVTPGWWSAILQVAASAPDVASVTPFSNHAEICSFPELCVAAPVPEHLDQVAQALREAACEPIALPTAVGFCMWMNRAVLQHIGDFDRATFGRGYGEENDWCCRASGHGYRHLLAPGAYVAHLGGQSFGPLGERPGGVAMQRLLARYPHYALMIQQFVAGDPIAPARARARQQLEQMRV